MKISKFRSDYDPDCILMLTKNDDGDIIVSLNKLMQPNGEGEFRITTSGGQLLGETKIIRLFEEIIDAFNEVNECGKMNW